ncbi:MAG TPA: hypothetical protein VL651_04785, partial [Bacteroidia bacterium]|nr:hypothetical protein [Bacteroidia bacterium]
MASILYSFNRMNSSATKVSFSNVSSVTGHRSPVAWFLLFILCSPLFLHSQTTTRNDGTSTTTTTTTTATSTKTKVLIIPWEPRMFNCSSDISRAIANETGQKYDQMEEALRKGLVDELKHAFGSTCTVTSLIDDTAKMKDDLKYVYTCTSMSYTPTTFPLNPTKADSAKLKTASGVNNGQVQTDDAD